MIVRAAALAYTGAFGVGTVRSVQHGHGAAPFGIRTGLSPGLEALMGVGTALAAPWPLVVALWRNEAVARAGEASAGRARARQAALAAMFLAGAAAEPITRDALVGRLPAVDTAVALANVLFPTVMLVGALQALLDERSSP